jgi:hypothetical protein
MWRNEAWGNGLDWQAGPKPVEEINESKQQLITDDDGRRRRPGPAMLVLKIVGDLCKGLTSGR